MRIRLFPYMAAVSAGMLVLTGVWILDRSEEQRFRESNRADVLHQLSTVRAKLEGALNSRIFLGRGLVAYVSNHPEIDQAEFERLAKVLVSQQTGIGSVALYRDSIVSHIYPFQGHEAAIGFKPSSVPEEQEAIQRAINSRKTVIAGPVNLVEGGVGFINRTPIFLSPPNQPPETGRYWGLAGVIVDRDTIFQEAGLINSGNQEKNLPHSYQSVQFALRGKDGLGAEGEVFFGNGAIFSKNPVILQIKLPNGYWQVAAIPVGGWPKQAPISRWLRLGGGISALLTGVLVYIWVRSPEELRRAVQRATIALKESETKYRELVQNAKSIILKLDPAGNITFFNEFAQHFFGYSEQQIIGQNIVGTIVPFTDSFGQNLAEVIKQILLHPERDNHQENENIRRNGERVWIAWRNKALFDQNGNFTGLLCIGTDISDRKRTEEALRESENKFRLLFEQSKDAILLLENDKFIDCNQAAVEMIGATSKEQLLNLHPSELSPEKQPDGSYSFNKANENNALAISRGNLRFEWIHQRLDGSEFPVEVLLTAIPLQGKKLLHVVWRDITERKRAEESLKASEKRLRRQSTALLDLATDSKLTCGDLVVAIQAITETATCTLELERTSVWLYNQDKSGIICLDLYERSSDRHSSGTELLFVDYPKYFQALQTERMIAVHNACTDPRTNEFSANYLIPLGIISMLDAPIRLSGQMMGVICHEHIGKSRYWALEEENFAASLADFVALAMEGVERRRAQEALLKANEELEIRVEERTAALREANHQLVVEIRERQRSEAALRTSEEKFSKAFHASPDVMTITKLKDGSYVDVNETFLRSLGFEREEVIERTSKELNIWVNHEEREEMIQILQQKKSVSNLERQFRKKTGEIVVGLLSAEMIDLDDEPCLLVVCTDITELKKTEAALRQTEEKYRKIFENAVEGIFQTSVHGHYLSANPALARLYGYDSPEELINNINNVEHQIYVDPQQRLKFIELIEEHNSVFGFESQVYRRDGKIIWVSENTRAVRDEQEKIIYYEGTIEDITKRKVVEEALRYQQEQTEKLLLNILPQPIAERLRREESTIADIFKEATVLFADIVGFTELSANIPPVQLVEMLNEIFSSFDELTEEHGLEKIKTIGDAYMVVGGLPIPRKDHAHAIAEMALDMKIEIDRFNRQAGQNVQLRVGINTGPVIAGVIGIKKFIYDLWGDTVNTASRMESHGLAGQIQVTTTTYEILRDKYLFQKRGNIPIKGKGEMTTYLLTGRMR